MGSIWQQVTPKYEFPRINKDIKTDVLIVGGGITGILCAYFLHRANVPYVLAESGTIAR